MDRKQPLPPTFFLASIVAMVGLHFLLPLRQLIHFPWRWLGAIPAILGLVLELVADGVFKRVQTTVKPFETSTTLVTTGVFRITRNPMYLGMIFMLLGLWIGLGSLSSLVPVPVLLVLLDRAFIRPEEAMLRATFKDQYEAYCRSVRRWI